MFQVVTRQLPASTDQRAPAEWAWMKQRFPGHAHGTYTCESPSWATVRWAFQRAPKFSLRRLARKMLRGRPVRTTKADDASSRAVDYRTTRTTPSTVRFAMQTRPVLVADPTAAECNVQRSVVAAVKWIWPIWRDLTADVCPRSCAEYSRTFWKLW